MSDQLHTTRNKKYTDSVYTEFYRQPSRVGGEEQSTFKQRYPETLVLEYDL